MRALAQTTNYR